MHFRTTKFLKLVGLIGCVLAIAWPQASGSAREGEDIRREANAGTVRVLAAGVDTANLLHELAATLNKTGSLRILPIMGDGGVQNVHDILYLRGIDMGLVRYDVLDQLRTQKIFGTIQKRIRYVTKLFDEEVHVIARGNISSIEQLSGQRVNYGDPGGGAFERSDRIFRSLGIKPVPVSYSTSQAIEKVRSGEIAATVHVGPSPSPFVRQLEAGEGVRLLSVPFIPELKGLYSSSSLSHIDYPGLIPQGETRSTLSVETVLAVYSWEKPNERSEKVDNFVNAFFGRLGEFQQADGHPKWRDVSPLDDVPGWQRLKVASDWVTTRTAKLEVEKQQATAAVSKPLRRQFEAFMSYMHQQREVQERRQAQATAVNSSNQRLEELFTNFLRWREEQTR